MRSPRPLVRRESCRWGVPRCRPELSRTGRRTAAAPRPRPRRCPMPRREPRPRTARGQSSPCDSSGPPDLVAPLSCASSYIASTTTIAAQRSERAGPAGVGINGIFGDGADGSQTIAASTTLTRDTYYADLTVAPGVTLDPGGYRIFVAGTLTLQNGSRISRDGSGATASGPPAGLTAGSVGGSGPGANHGLCLGGTASNSLGGSGGTGTACPGGPAVPPSAAVGGPQAFNSALFGLSGRTLDGVVVSGGARRGRWEHRIRQRRSGRGRGHRGRALVQRERDRAGHGQRRRQRRQRRWWWRRRCRRRVHLAPTDRRHTLGRRWGRLAAHGKRRIRELDELKPRRDSAPRDRARRCHRSSAVTFAARRLSWE